MNLVEFNVKWRGSVHVLPKLDVESSTVGELKDLIYTLLDVQPSNQKLIGICKSSLSKLRDEHILGKLDVKLTGDVCSFILMGSPDNELDLKEDGGSEFEKVDHGEVINDLSLEFGPASKIWQQLQRHSLACQIHWVNFWMFIQTF